MWRGVLPTRAQHQRQRVLRRRRQAGGVAPLVLRASAVTVLAVGAGTALAACGRNEHPRRLAHDVDELPPRPPPGMNFAAVAPNSEDVVVIPDGYEHAVVISWGDPVLPGAPEFDVGAQTGAAQRGSSASTTTSPGCCRSRASTDRFLLVTNHEYATPQFMFPGYDADAPTREQFDIEIAALGMAVVEVERTAAGGLQAGDGPLQPPHHRRHSDDARPGPAPEPTS